MDGIEFWILVENLVYQPYFSTFSQRKHCSNDNSRFPNLQAVVSIYTQLDSVETPPRITNLVVVECLCRMVNGYALVSSSNVAG